MRRFLLVMIVLLVIGPLVMPRFAGAVGASAATRPGWTMIPVPTGVSGYLDAVTCLSATDCFAGGVANSNAVLITHLEGGTWRVAQGPSVGLDVTGQIRGIACVSATVCFAVGDSVTVTASSGIIEAYRGQSWKLVQSPVNVAQWTAVTCGRSPAICWAVGSKVNGSPVIVRYRDSSWLEVPAPRKNLGSSLSLLSISCAGANLCIAVGGEGPAYEEKRPVSEIWNGTSWRVVNLTSPLSTVVSLLQSVSCLSKAISPVCVAVGFAGSSKKPPPGAVGIEIPLIYRYQRGDWTATPSPPGDLDHYPALAAISCTSATWCWAVGSQGPGQDTSSTLAEHWNGTTWKWATTPDPPAEYRSLSAVACPDNEECWAVGGAGKPLIVNWRN
jgi:hypothetical protein